MPSAAHRAIQRDSCCISCLERSSSRPERGPVRHVRHARIREVTQTRLETAARRRARSRGPGIRAEHDVRAPDGLGRSRTARRSRGESARCRSLAQPLACARPRFACRGNGVSHPDRRMWLLASAGAVGGAGRAEARRRPASGVAGSCARLCRRLRRRSRLARRGRARPSLAQTRAPIASSIALRCRHHLNLTQEFGAAGRDGLTAHASRSCPTDKERRRQ